MLIRGHLIPIYRDGEFQNIDEIENPEKVMERFLNSICSIMKDLMKDQLPIDNEEKVKIFNDLIIIAIYYALWKNRRESFIHLIAKIVKKDLKDIRNRVSLIFTEERTNAIIDAYYKLPADTRPGLNTSSLLIHMVMTSTLVTCYAESMAEMEKLDRELLRTASLFHDIGKPLDWPNHAEMSKNEFIKRFEDFFDNEYLRRIGNCIANHHKTSDIPFYNYLIKCDRFASQNDRMREVVIDLLEEDMGDWIKNEHDFHKNYKKWNELRPRFKELTKKFLDKYKDYEFKYKTILPKGEYFALLIGDMRQIKKYVDNVNKLSELCGASYIVEDVINNKIPLKLYELGLPPECILMVGGGNILIIVPGKNAENIANTLENAFKEETKGGAKLVAKYIKFGFTENTFNEIYMQLNLELRNFKNELKDITVPIIPGSLQLCESCGSNYVPNFSEFGGQKLHYCPACLHKLSRGLDIYGKTRWSQFKDAVGIEWNEIMNKFLEFLAGVPPEKIKEYNQKIKSDAENAKKLTLSSPNLGILVADGNLMGEFMAKTTTITELVEKNIRISNAVNNAFEKIYDELEKES
ncbi:MAG: HD domain-containing protein, partial [Candidatus Helarchaeota archaeon]